MYYEKLFASTNVANSSVSEYLFFVDIPYQLTNTDKVFCGKAVMEDKIVNVIVSLKTCRSSGLDGLTPEFC